MLTHVGVGREPVARLDEVGHLLPHQHVAAAVLVRTDAAGKRGEQLLSARDGVGREELADLGVLQQEGGGAEGDDLGRYGLLFLGGMRGLWVRVRV